MRRGLRQGRGQGFCKYAKFRSSPSTCCLLFSYISSHISPRIYPRAYIPAYIPSYIPSYGNERAALVYRWLAVPAASLPQQEDPCPGRAGPSSQLCSVGSSLGTQPQGRRFEPSPPHDCDTAPAAPAAPPAIFAGLQGQSRSLGARRARAADLVVVCPDYYPLGRAGCGPCPPVGKGLRAIRGCVPPPYFWERFWDGLSLVGSAAGVA